MVGEVVAGGIKSVWNFACTHGKMKSGPPFMSVKAGVDAEVHCSQRPSKPCATGLMDSLKAAVNRATSSALGFVNEYFHSHRRKSLPTSASLPCFLGTAVL